MVAAGPPHGHDADVVVLGAGAIGLSVAWRLAVEGVRVVIVDAHPGGGASDVAAGMLAPVTELTYGEEALSRLTVASAERYPSFAAELEAASGVHAGYRRTGTLTVALDRDDLAAIDDLHRYIQAQGMRTERLNAGEARRREPLLAPEVHGAMLAPDDHVVDPRLMVRALREAAGRLGVRQLRERAARLTVEGGRVTGAELEDGRRIAARQTVVAAGADSARLSAGVEDVPLRPVKGQLLVLRTSDGMPLLHAVVRGLAHGFAVYLVPRSDGRLIVGATVEERGFDTSVTADAIYSLLRDARRLVPATSELELVECRAGLRPGTPDNGPILGEGATPGLIWATGHHRNGILLAPITADAIAALVVNGEMPAIAAPFASARFARGKVRS